MAGRSKPRAPSILAQHYAPRTRKITDRASLEAMHNALVASWGPNVLAQAETWARDTVAADDAETRRYAAAILNQAANVRHALGPHGDPDELLHAALHLGSLLKEANIVLRFGPAIDTGLKQYDGLLQRRTLRNRATQHAARCEHAAWRREAEIVWQRRPALTVSACAAAVRKALQSPKARKTVADAIRDLKPCRKLATLA